MLIIIIIIIIIIVIIIIIIIHKCEHHFQTVVGSILGCT